MYLYVLDYIPELLVPTQTKFILVCTNTNLVHTEYNSLYWDKLGTYCYIPIYTYTILEYIPYAGLHAQLLIHDVAYIGKIWWNDVYTRLYLVYSSIWQYVLVSSKYILVPSAYVLLYWGDEQASARNC